MIFRSLEELYEAVQTELFHHHFSYEEFLRWICDVQNSKVRLIRNVTYQDSSA